MTAIWKDNHITFEFIEKNEKERQSIQSISSLYGMIVFFLKKTTMMDIIMQPLLWISMLVYILSQYALLIDPKAHYSFETSFQPMRTISTSMSFLIVFFVSDCYKRFQRQYDSVALNNSKIYDIMLNGRAILSYEEQLRLWRYLNIAHILSFMTTSYIYTFESLLYPLQKKYILLNETEIDILNQKYINIKSDDSSELCYGIVQEVFGWITDNIFHLYKNDKIKYFDAYPILNQVQEMNRNFNKQISLTQFRVPLSYLFIVEASVQLYLPLFAYYTAQQVNPNGQFYSDTQVTQSIVCVFFNSVFYIFMLKLGKELQEPYGLKHQDIRVLSILETTLKESAKLIQSSSIHSNSFAKTELELNLLKQRNNSESTGDIKNA